MKQTHISITAFVIAISLILASNARASLWDVTFTAGPIQDVGRIDDSETIFQGDPDLYFAMQIESFGPQTTGVFYSESPVSTTNWYVQRSVTLTNIVSATDAPPKSYFSFWLFDDDSPLNTDDLLGVHSFSAASDIAPTTSFNNNQRWSFLPAPVAYEGSGWSSNYRLTYSVKFDSTVPIPPSIWLFGSGFLGLIAVARRKTA